MSIGYGVHSDHRGESPTWYLRGRHVGFSTRDPMNRDLSPQSRIPKALIKNFSFARIVSGPLGDPLTDADFRRQMGIAEILQH